MNICPLSGSGNKTHIWLSIPKQNCSTFLKGLKPGNFVFVVPPKNRMKLGVTTVSHL